MSDIVDGLTSVFQWVMTVSLSAGVLVGVILVIKGLVGERLDRRWHYALWLVMVIRLVLPWSPGASWSIETLVDTGTHSLSSHFVGVPVDAGSQPRGVTQTAGTTAPDELTQAGSGSATGEPAVTQPTAPGSTSATVPGGRATHSMPWNLYAMWVWLAGMVVTGGLMVRNQRRFFLGLGKGVLLTGTAVQGAWKAARELTGVHRQLPLVKTDRVGTPALAGVFRPRLLLPSYMFELDPVTLKYVFVHELAHLRRRDMLINGVVQVLLAVHWFNPLLWYGVHHMKEDQELACDATTLSCLDRSEAGEYGRTLISLLEHVARVPVYSVVGIAESKQVMKRRLQLVMKARNRSIMFSILGIVVIAAVAIVALSGGGAMKKPAPPIGNSAKPGTETNHVPIQVVDPVDIQMANSSQGWIVTRSRVLHTVSDSSWEDVTPPGATDLRWSSLGVVGNDTAWLAVAEGVGSPVTVYHTTDGGQHWQAQTPGTTGSPEIQFADDQLGWLFVHQGIAAGSEGVALLNTTDGGETWKLLAQAPAADSNQSNPMPLGGGKTGFTMVDSQVGWLTGFDYGPELYLYRTMDGGQTWLRQPLEAPEGYTVGGGSGVTYPPRFFDDKQGVLPVIISGQGQVLVFYLTTDGGITWNIQEPIEAIGEGRFQYSIVDRTQLVACDGKALFVSRDEGQNWQTVEPDTSLAGLTKLEFVSPDAGWAIVQSTQDGSSRLLQTTDGGQTWKAVDAVQ